MLEMGCLPQAHAGIDKLRKVKKYLFKNMIVHMLNVLCFIEDKLKTKQSQESQNQNYD